MLLTLLLLWISNSAWAYPREDVLNMRRAAGTELTRLPGHSGATHFDVFYGDARSYTVKGYDAHGKLLKTSNVTLDSNGFRYTPHGDPPGARRHLLIGGCSYTFGHHVEDDETFAALMARELKDWRVLNIGRSGGSPVEAYFLLSRYDLRSARLPAEGVFVFTLIPGHIRRVIPSWQFLSDLHPTAPRFDVVDGVPTNFRLNHTTWDDRWAKAVRSWGLAGPWLRLVHWPSEFRVRRSLDLTVDYLRETKKAYLQQFPQGRFVVTFFSGLVPIYPELVTKITDAGIEYWDSTDPRLVGQGLFLTGDPHPSPLGHRVHAAFLLKRGQSYFGATSSPVPR